jgi:hypothetical protein
VAGTVFTRWLLVLPATTVETSLAVVDKCGMLLVGLLLVEMVTTVEPYHESDGALLALDNFSHG